MYTKLLSAALLSLSLPSVAKADYITPEELIEISPGVKVRSISAALITNPKIRDAVVELYQKEIPEMDPSISLVRGHDDCIVLFIDTKGNMKNFIKQMGISNNERCKKHTEDKEEEPKKPRPMPEGGISSEEV